MTKHEGIRKSSEVVAEAKALRRQGLDVYAIAKRFGVHHNTVRVWLDEPKRIRRRDERKSGRPLECVTKVKRGEMAVAETKRPISLSPVPPPRSVT